MRDPQVASWLFLTCECSCSAEKLFCVISTKPWDRVSTLISAPLALHRTLSQVIHAVAALLYPFTWQHTFISIVPEILVDVVMAPTPYLLGVQKRLLDLVTDQSDVSYWRTRENTTKKPNTCRTALIITFVLSPTQLLVVDLSVDRKETFIVSVSVSIT